MARFNDAQTILAAAEEWKRRCLIAGKSLFTEQSLWTRENFERLRQLYVESPIETAEPFLTKLERQLDPGPKEVKCLWAEMVWVYRLIAHPSSMRPDTKRDRIQKIWSWSGEDFPQEHRLLADDVLKAGVVHAANAYHVTEWAESRFFIVAMLTWFSMDEDQQESLLTDPWEFATWLDATEFSANRMFRHALLFLLFPDEFEPSISGKHKRTIVEELWEGRTPTESVAIDQALLAVRRHLEERSGGQEVHFYKSPFIQFWQPGESEEWHQSRFNGRGVWQMNMTVDGESRWPADAKDGLATIYWDKMGDLRRSRDDIHKDLVSRGHGKNPVMRSQFLWAFANKMEVGDIVIATRKGAGLLGWGRVTGDYRYDPGGGKFRVHTRTVQWHEGNEEIRLFSGWIAVKRLTDYRQSLCWVRLAFWLMGDPVDGTATSCTIADAHQDLLLPLDDFTRLFTSIKSRKNLILQGPPGTGKTFIARRIAWCLIGRKDDDPIEMVQFHQSYAYEDFVEGFRPTNAGGFELKPGVFRRFCERARAKPDTPHVFIIDEINRGNLSRIFGELLMLIERDKRNEDYAVVLTYSDKRFHIPENVYILGMMNTADRSLALVDYALRRRFAFETLEPVFGTAYGRAAFNKYLVNEKGADPELVSRISDRMDQLNKTIRDDKELGSGFQIGHSYFLPNDGDEPSEDWYKHVVDTQIAPLLREYWFDSPEGVEKEVARLTADA